MPERYASIEPLRVASGEADLYRARDLQAGDTCVVKIYRGTQRGNAGSGPVDEVWNAWRTLCDQTAGVVRLRDAGMLGDRAWEVMEDVAGGDLHRLRLQSPGERLDESVVVDVLRTVVPALTGLHDLGIVHCDVKPSNILVRVREKDFAVALADFGASRPRPGPHDLVDAEGLTDEYAAPEWLLGHQLGPEADWWSLGMTIAELAGGRHPQAGMSERRIRNQYAARRLDLDALDPESRIARLCSGLLTFEPEFRWTGEKVTAWIDGADPAVAVNAPTAPETRLRPFVYRDVEYTTPGTLARAFEESWETVAAVLGGRGWRRSLREWTEQEGFPARSTTPAQLFDGFGHTKDPNLKVFLLLQWLAPEEPPNYRGWLLTPHLFREMACDTAMSVIFQMGALPVSTAGLPEAADPVDALREIGELHLLDRTGYGFDTELERWHSAGAWWGTAVTRLREERRGIETRLNTAAATAARIAGLWWIATAPAEAETSLRNAIDDRAREAPVASAAAPWYTELTAADAPPESLLLALLLHGLAVEDTDEHARRELRDYLERHADSERGVFAHWEYIEGRRLALEPAAIAVGAVTVLWVTLLVLTGLLPLAGRGAVALGWVCGGLSVLWLAAAECGLAWATANRYYPDYAMADAGLRWAERRLRGSMRTGWPGFLMIVASAAVLVLLLSYVPPVPALVATGAHLWWTHDRVRRWQNHRAAQRERAEQERRDRTGPPDNPTEGDR